MKSRKKPQYSETERLDFSQVHIEQFFAICYCLTPFGCFLRVYVAIFQFFVGDRRLTDRRLTDGQNRLLNPASRMRARGNDIPLEEGNRNELTANYLT